MANFFDKMVSGLNKGVTTVSTESKVIVEKAKINTKLSEIKKEQEKLLLDLGRAVYYKCKSGELTLNNCEGILNALKEKEKITDNLNNRINALNEMQKEQDQMLSADITVCPYCGKSNKSGSRFCSGCGKNIADAEPESAQIKEEVSEVQSTETKEGEE